MAIQTTYSEVRAKLASFMNLTIKDNEIVIIKRRGKEPVSLIAESELRGLEETAHLLRSPKNARRLQRALDRALAGQVKPLKGLINSEFKISDYSQGKIFKNGLEGC
jgi:antitoxin YefM